MYGFGDTAVTLIVFNDLFKILFHNASDCFKYLSRIFSYYTEKEIHFFKFDKQVFFVLTWQRLLTN